MTSLDPVGVSAAAKALAVAQRHFDAVVAAGGDPLPADPDSALAKRCVRCGDTDFLGIEESDHCADCCWCEAHGEDIARRAASPADKRTIPPHGRWTTTVWPRGESVEVVAAADYDALRAASPADERLREALRDANEYLAQIADYSPSEVADAIDSVRAQIKDALAATDSRGKPDGASVPDQTRRIVVYDARCGRGGLDVPVGCTVGEAALLAAEMFGVRVGPNDRPSFGLRGTGLHASDPLPDDEDYELFVIGGTV